MMHDIASVLNRLAAKSKQLIGNHTTNLAECWMHIRTKFDGGKVINRSQSGSWEHRCMGAGLRHNLGAKWGPQVWKKMTNNSPNKIFSTVAKNAAKQVEKNRKRKATEQAKEMRRKNKYIRIDNTAAARGAYNRHDEGICPEEVDDNLSSEELERLKTSFYETKVVITVEKAKEIEAETRSQADCELWITERRKRLTASRIGSIAKMRKTTKRSTKVQNILYSTFRGNEATRYGVANEGKARQDYALYLQQSGCPDLEVALCGLFVSIDEPWLAASPDGVIVNCKDSNIVRLLEVKCPFSAKSKTISEACKSATFFLESADESCQLKRRHDYYFQIQCQLFCVNCEWCDLVVKTEMDVHIERIYRDKKWWSLQLDQLRTFYFDSLLAELTCPQHRAGGIREPNH